MNWFKKKNKYIRSGDVIFKVSDIEDCEMAATVNEDGVWELKIFIKSGACITRTYETKEGADKALDFIWSWMKDL